MLVSILHRATGDGMAVIGGILLVGWLLAIASGPEGYAWYVGWATSPIGYLLMIGLSWAFFQHMCSGLRHFVLDIGAGYEVDRNNRWAAIVPMLGLVFTAFFWAIVFFV